MLKVIQFFFVGFLLLLLACRDEAAHQLAVKNLTDEKINAYKEKRKKDCVNAWFDEASKKADSIMILNADIWQWNDTLIRPKLMTRPDKPTFKNADSIGIKPLFEKKRG